MTTKNVVTTFSRSSLPVFHSSSRCSSAPWMEERRADSFRINRQISHKAILLHARETALYETASKLDDLVITWALIADEHQAHIFEYDKSAEELWLAQSRRYDKQSQFEWKLIPDGFINAQSLDIYQRGHALLGGFSYIKKIADKLEHARERNAFDHLVLVAPPAMIADLRECLDARTQSCIVGVMSKCPSIS